MAYVRIYYHREPQRIAPRVRSIARRPESDGPRGLGTAIASRHERDRPAGWLDR